MNDVRSKADPYHPDRVNTNLYFAMQDAVSLMCALELILPMAKGYAHAHDLGNNKYFVKKAEESLDKFKEKHPEYNDYEEQSENELVRDDGQFGMGA